MRRPSLLLALPVLLSGCAVAPDPVTGTGRGDGASESAADLSALLDDHGPSEISPDEEQLCTDGEDRDCTDEGQLRWSLPLEGEYRFLPEETGLHHIDTGAHGYGVDQGGSGLAPGRFTATEAAGGDVLVYSENARVRGIDPDTGELLWRTELAEEVEEGEAGFLRSGVTGLHPLGGDLLVLFDGGFVVMDPDEGTVGSASPTRSPLGTLEHVQGDHVVIERSGPDDRPHFSTVDVSDGQVAWEGSLPEGQTEVAGVYGHHIHVVWNNVSPTSSEGLLARMDIRDGDLEYLIDGPFIEGRTYSELAGLHPDGYAVFDSEEGTYAYDYEEDEIVWEGESSRGDLTPVDTPDGPAFRRMTDELVDARTGDTLPEGTGTEDLAPTEGHAGTASQLRLRDWLEGIMTQLEGPADAPHGAGTVGLSQGDTSMVAVACAPDGLREPDPEDRSYGALCDEPRLYSVNHSD